MKIKSETERMTFKKLIGEAFFWLSLPIVVITCVVMTHICLPGFWTEIIVAFAASILILLVVIQNETTDNEHRDLLRDLLIISTLSIILTIIGDREIQNPNEFGPVPLILQIILTVIGLTFTVKFHFGKNRRYWIEKDYVYVSISKIFGSVIGMILLSRMYIYFGTQFIWLSALPLFIFLACFLSTRDIEKFLKQYSDLLFIVIVFSPLGIAAISTLYQFWFAEIFSDWKLWNLLLTLLSISAIFGIIFLFLFLKRRKKEKLINLKRQEIQTQKAEEERIQKEKDENALLLKLDSESDSMRKTERVYWGQIFLFSRHYRQDLNKFYYKILPFICYADLMELVEVSEIKRHIVWDADFYEALGLLEKFAIKCYDDTRLVGFIDQLNSFVNKLNEYKEFEGYSKCISEVKSRYNVIYEKLSIQK